MAINGKTPVKGIGYCRSPRMTGSDATSIIAQMVAQEIEIRKSEPTPDPKPIGNLQYVLPETRAKIEAVLADDAVHFATKKIIRHGLRRDCLDAARDAKLAADLLAQVHRDCMRIPD